MCVLRLGVSLVRPGRPACRRAPWPSPVQFRSLRAFHPTLMLLFCRTSHTLALGSVSFIPCSWWEMLSGLGSSCPGPCSPLL